MYPAMISRPPPPLWAHHHGGVLWQVRAAAGRSQMFEASAGRAADHILRQGLSSMEEKHLLYLMWPPA